MRISHFIMVACQIAGRRPLFCSWFRPYFSTSILRGLLADHHQTLLHVW